MKKGLIIAAIGFLLAVFLGLVWADAEPAGFGGNLRTMLGLALGLFAAAALFVLVRQAEIISRTRQELRQSEFARDDFNTGISHEIRTPLSGILGIMHLLKRTELDRNQQRYVDTATNSAKMLLATINDMFDDARTDTRGLPLESEIFDIAEVVEDVASILAAEASQKNLELICGIDPDIPQWFRGDALRMRQVLNNLVNNAIRHADRGVVLIEVSRDDNNIEIGVSGSDIEISPETRAELASPLAQSDEINNQDAGAALILSRRLIEAMQSELQVTGKTGEGSRFFFVLPIDPELGASFDWRPPQALRQLSIGLLSPWALRRVTISKLLAHWQIDDIQALDYDVERAADLPDMKPCDLLLVDQVETQQAVDDLIERLRNNSAWRDTRFACLVPQNRASEGGSADVHLYKPLSHARLYSMLLDTVYKRAFDAEYDAESVGAGAEVKPFTGRRILLAEDNDINKMIVLEMLAETGVEVDVVVTGAEALQQVKQQTYDLVLMDIQMPDMDGIEATRAIRALGDDYASLPIIAMTAHALEGYSSKSIAAGMDYHISKPFEPDKFLAVVQRFFDERRGQQT